MSVSGVNSGISNSIENLSSGSKTTGAAESGIAESIKSEITGLKGNSKNAQDGINFANVAEGALNGISDMLIRIKELSVRANSGINSSSDLRLIQNEIKHNLESIESVAKRTSINSHNLLDGSKSSMNIATNRDGSGSQIKMANVTLEGLGLKDYDVTGDFDISKVDEAIDKVSEYRSAFGATSNGLRHTSDSIENTIIKTTESLSTIQSLEIAKGIMDLERNKTMRDVGFVMLQNQMETKKGILNLFA